MKFKTNQEKRTFWQSVAKEFWNSGLKLSTFCHQRKIGPSQLQYWLKKENCCKSVEPAFIEVIPKSTNNHSRLEIIEISFPSGIRLSFESSMNPTSLSQIIRVLREATC